MYTLHLSPLGEVTLHLDTVHISGFNIYLTGYDDDNNRIDFTMDKLCYLEDIPYDFGYCHILSYTKNGISTPCNIYRSLS